MTSMDPIVERGERRGLSSVSLGGILPNIKKGKKRSAKRKGSFNFRQGFIMKVILEPPLAKKMLTNRFYR